MPNIALEVARTLALLVWDNRRRPERSSRGTDPESAGDSMTILTGTTMTEAKPAGSVAQGQPKTEPQELSSSALPPTSQRSPYAQTSKPDYSGTSQLSTAGKACIPCGSDHLSAATASLSEAIRFARTGGIVDPEVVSRITLAMDELNAFERIDGAPEKVTKLPPHEKKMMDDMMAASREIRHHITNISTPTDLENTAALARQHRIYFFAKQIKMSTKEV